MKDLLSHQDHNITVYYMPLPPSLEQKVCVACTRVSRQMYGELAHRGDSTFSCKCKEHWTPLGIERYVHVKFTVFKKEY